MHFARLFVSFSFGENRQHLGNKRKNVFFFVFRSICTIFAAENEMIMKQVLLSLALALLAVTALEGCATAEERAARAAEHAARVKVALTERHYKISVDHMYTMRGGSKSVSSSYSVEVRNDSLFSYLPFFGRAYQVPYGGGKGLNFSERIGSYRESLVKNGCRHIEINVKNDEDSYLYVIDVFDNGNSDIEVQAQQRERISYSGEMVFE